MMHKRWISILFAIWIVASMLLASCAQATPAPETVATEAAAATEAPAVETKPFDGQKISVLVLGGFEPYTGPANTSAEEFMEKFGGEVEVIETPYTGMREKILTDLTTEAGSFDVTMLAGEWDGETFPYMLVLDDLIKRDNFDLEDFYPKALNAMGYFEDVGRFGIPYAAGSYGLVYRQDIFDKEGLKPPETWDEYIQMAKMLQEKYGPEGMYATAIAATGGSAWKSWSSRFWEQDQRMFDDDYKAIFANEAGEKAFQMLEDLKPYMPPDVVSFDNPEVNAAFLAGDLVMAEHWPTMVLGEVSDPEKSKLTPEQVGMASVPGGANFYTWSYGIPKASKNQEMAWAFLSYLNNKENTKRWLDDFALPATRISALEDNPFLAGALENGKILPFQLPIFGEWWDAANKMTSEVLSGQKSSEQALEDNANLWNDLLGTVEITRKYTGD